MVCRTSRMQQRGTGLGARGRLTVTAAPGREADAGAKDDDKDDAGDGSPPPTRGGLLHVLVLSEPVTVALRLDRLGPGRKRRSTTLDDPWILLLGR